MVPGNSKVKLISHNKIKIKESHVRMLHTFIANAYVELLNDLLGFVYVNMDWQDLNTGEIIKNFIICECYIHEIACIVITNGIANPYKYIDGLRIYTAGLYVIGCIYKYVEQSCCTNNRDKTMERYQENSVIKEIMDYKYKYTILWDC